MATTMYFEETVMDQEGEHSLHLAARRCTPNNSFKPKPLRAWPNSDF